MKPIALLFASMVASSVLAAPTELTRFEKQLRSDLYAILKTRWPAQKVSEDANAYADKWLLELKTSYPDLLPSEAEPTVPTDVQLGKLQMEASHLRIPKSRGEIWCFYQEDWRHRLSVEQKVLFGRFLNIVIAEAKKHMPSEADIQRLDPDLPKEPAGATGDSQIQKIEGRRDRVRVKF